MILINNYTIMTKVICDKHDIILKKDKKIRFFQLTWK